MNLSCLCLLRLKIPGRNLQFSSIECEISNLHKTHSHLNLIHTPMSECNINYIILILLLRLN